MTAVVLRARWLLSALLIAGAALFALGVAAERSTDDHHRSLVAQVEGGAEAAEHGETALAATAHSEDDATLLGINLESTSLVVTAALVSVAFALLVSIRAARWLLWVVAAFAASFAVLDAAEVVHQIDENRTGIAVIAAVVTVVHLAATLVAETRATNWAAIP